MRPFKIKNKSDATTGLTYKKILEINQNFIPDQIEESAYLNITSDRLVEEYCDLYDKYVKLQLKEVMLTKENIRLTKEIYDLKYN